MLMALRLYHPRNIPGTHFCQRLSRLQGHSAAGRIMSMKNSNDIIGNRTRDLPSCNAVLQPTAPPRNVVTRRISSQNSNDATHNTFSLKEKSDCIQKTYVASRADSCEC